MAEMTPWEIAKRLWGVARSVPGANPFRLVENTATAGAGVVEGLADAASGPGRALRGDYSGPTLYNEYGEVVRAPRPMLPDALKTASLMTGGAPLGSAPKGALRAGIARAPFDTGGGGIMTPKATARYRGAAPDRTTLSHLRYIPKKPSPRLDAAMKALKDPKNPQRMALDADIVKGAGPGRDWYNTEELRDWFIRAHGPKKGHAQWVEAMELMGTMSPGSRVPANIKNMSAARRQLHLDPTYLPRMTDPKSATLSGALQNKQYRLPGYGHKVQGTQDMATARYLQGGWKGVPEATVVPPTKSRMVENAKPKGFAASLMGSQGQIAADLHFTRAFGMASKDPRWMVNGAEIGKTAKADFLKANPKLKNFMREGKGGKILIDARKAVEKGAAKFDDFLGTPQAFAEKPAPNEYGLMERFWRDEVAKAHNMTPAQAQASLWMGAAERTGVDATSQVTFMDALRNVARQRAAKTGQTAEQVLKEFVNNYGLLTGAGAVTAGAAITNPLQRALIERAN